MLPFNKANLRVNKKAFIITTNRESIKSDKLL